MTIITNTLLVDLFMYMISRLLLVRMRNVVDKICRENEKELFVFDTVFPKIVLFVQ
jgi:hypothetical protein